MVSFWVTLLQAFRAKKNQHANIIKQTQILSIKQIRTKTSKPSVSVSMNLEKFLTIFIKVGQVSPF